MAVQGSSFSVHGEAVPSPVSEITKLGLNRNLLTVACGRGMKSPMSLQKHMWPSIIRGRSVVCISKKNSGKTIGYLLPIINCVMEIEEEKKGDASDNHGPIALILVPSSEIAERVGKFCTVLISSAANVKCVVLNSDISERIAYCKLLNGCSVLISTPQAFLKALLSPASLPRIFTNLRRLAHLVIDDAEFLLSKCEESITKILREIRTDLAARQNKGSSSGVQFVVTASERTKEVDEFYESLTLYQPILIKGAGFKD